MAVKLTFKVNDVFEKEMKRFYDDGYLAVIEKVPGAINFGVMKLHHYHEDGSEFVFCTLLFCPELKTIYIPHIYGYNFHSFEAEIEYWDAETLESRCGMDVMKYLLTWYPEYTNVKHFTKEDFEDQVNNYRGGLVNQGVALSSKLPYNVVDSILQTNKPSWMDYEFLSYDLKDRLQLHNIDYQGSVDMFETPYVYVSIE
jgi:hypothetical protein